MDEGVDGNAILKHNSWRSAQFVANTEMIPSSSRDFYSSYRSAVWNIARDLNSGMKGMRMGAEFREHKHGKVFMRKYKNNYVAQCIQIICGDVITL